MLTRRTSDLTETDAVLSTGGKLTVSDKDATDATVVVQTGSEEPTPKFSLQAAGICTYTTNDAVDSLNADPNVTVTFTVTTTTGGSATVTVNINDTEAVSTLTNDT